MKTEIKSPVYLAGPMTGIEGLNFPAFDAAAGWLQSLGVEVVNPAQLDRDAGFNPDTMEVTEQVTKDAIARDLKAIRGCKSIVLLDGWKDSTGAMAEYHLAKWMGLEVRELSKLKFEHSVFKEMPVDVGSPADNEFRWSKIAAKVDAKERVESSHPADQPKADIKESNPKDRIGSTKTPFDLVPAHVVMELSLAMLEGARKYGPYNYRSIGIRASIYYSAMMRHMTAWWEGEDIDEESGLSHITKAMACLTILRDADLLGKMEDDRPPRVPAGWVEDLNGMAEQIITDHEEN